MLDVLCHVALVEAVVDHVHAVEVVDLDLALEHLQQVGRVFGLEVVAIGDEGKEIVALEPGLGQEVLHDLGYRAVFWIDQSYLVGLIVVALVAQGSGDAHDVVASQ